VESCPPLNTTTARFINHLDSYGKNIMLPSDYGDDQLLHDLGAGSQASVKSNQPRVLSRMPLTPGGALIWYW